MKNKKVINNLFNEKFSIDNNYKAIMKKVNEKPKYRLSYILTPVFTVILIVFGLIIFNTNIYINNLSNDIFVPIRSTFSLIEYDVEKDYAFIKNIKIPKELDKKEEGANYTGLNSLEISEYILTFYNIELDKSIKIVFSQADVSILDEKLKSTKIKKEEVTIASYGDNYYVDFSHNELNFNITTKNIDKKELINLIKSIIK